MNISERLKWLRTSNKMSQQELAAELGVSRGYIPTLESDPGKVKDRIIKLYASYFSVREEWIKSGALPIRQTLADIVEDQIAQAYFALAAELAPSISTPELLTKLLIQSPEYAEMFHYLNSRFLAKTDKNEPKRLSALFSMAFPDYRDVAKGLISSVSEEYKEKIRKPLLVTRAQVAAGSAAIEKAKTKTAPRTISDTVPVRIYGEAAAGSPLFNTVDDDIFVNVPKKYSDPDRFVAVCARGDSMEPEISSGDIVIAQRDLIPQAGQAALICLAGMADDEYTIKQVYPDGDSLVLRSYNKIYPDMTYSWNELRSCDAIVHIIPTQDE